MGAAEWTGDSMRKFSWMLGLAVAALVVGCGSNGFNATAMVSGAYQTTLNVTMTASSGSGGIGGPSTQPNLIISFSDDSASDTLSTPGLSAGVAMPGNSPQLGTFTSSNAISAESDFLRASTTGGVSSFWEQQFSEDSPAAEMGTFSLTLTSSGSLGGASVALEGRTEWLNPHGSFSATLAPGSGGAEPSNSTISFNITF
jgi:hypothetical protein